MSAFRTDIWTAASTGDSKTLAGLLKKEAEVPVDILNDWGVTPLMLACSRGHEDAAAMLLEAGAALGLQDRESGYSALHRAFLQCHLIVAALLVRAGASVDAPLDKEGLSPLLLLQRRFASNAWLSAKSMPTGDIFTWGQAGNVALGRGETSASLAVAPGRAEVPPFTTARTVAVAKHHTLLVDAGGGVHSCGLGVGGRLGHGDEAAVVLPTRVRLRVRVVAIAAGLGHSLAVGECGGVWSWGALDAPLGYETAAAQLTPRKLKLSTHAPVAAVATSDTHALAASREGHVYAWGCNRRGQLGLGGAVDETATPRRVDALVNARSFVTCVAAGAVHSAAVTREGHAMCWGFDRGPTKVKLGEGKPSGRFRSHHKVSKPLAVQVVCGRSHVAAVASTGAVYVWDEQLSPRVVRLPGACVTSVAAARYTTLAVTAAGDVFQWDEHWHAGWVPKPKKLAGLRQVVFATAADQHCAALLAVQRPFSASAAHGGVSAGAATDGADAQLADAQAEARERESDDDDADALSDSTDHSTEHSTEHNTEQSTEQTTEHGASERDDLYATALSSDYAPYASSPRVGSSGDKGPRVPTLKLLCERALTATANPRNVLQLLYTADVIQAEAMRAFCAEMVSLNLPLLLSAELWAHLPHNLLQLLRDTLRPRCAELLHASANTSRLAAILREEAAAEEAAATARAETSAPPFGSPTGQTPLSAATRARQLRKKLKQIDELERRRTLGGLAGKLTAPQRVKLEGKAALATALEELLALHPEAAPTPSPSALPAAAPADCPPLDAADATPAPASAETAACGTDSAIPSVAGHGVSLLLPVTLRLQRVTNESESGGRGGAGASASPLPLAPSDMLQGQLRQDAQVHPSTSAGAPASRRAASSGRKKSSWSALPLTASAEDKQDKAEVPAERALQSSIQGWGYREMGATPASAAAAPLLAEIQREQQRQQRQALSKTVARAVEGRAAAGKSAPASAGATSGPAAEAEESVGSRPMQLPILHFVRQPSSAAKENAIASREAARDGPAWGAASAAPAVQPSRSLHDILAEEEAERRKVKEEEQRQMREQRERARDAAARERERAAGLRPAWGGAAIAAAATFAPSPPSAASLLDIVAEQVAEDERRKAARSQRQASAWTAASPKPLLPWASPTAHVSPPTSWGFLPEPPVYSLAEIQTEELIQTLEAPTPSAATQPAALDTPAADSATKTPKKVSARESGSAARAHSKRAADPAGAPNSSGGHRGRHRGKAATEDKAAAEDTATATGEGFSVTSEGGPRGAKAKAAGAKAKAASRPARDTATPSAPRDALRLKPTKQPRKPAPSTTGADAAVADAVADAVIDAVASAANAEPCAIDRPRRERHGRPAPRGPKRAEPGTVLETGGARVLADGGGARGGTRRGGPPGSSGSAPRTANESVAADGDGGGQIARGGEKPRGGGDDGGDDGGKRAGARKHSARRAAGGPNLTAACGAAAVGA